ATDARSAQMPGLTSPATCTAPPPALPGISLPLWSRSSYQQRAESLGSSPPVRSHGLPEFLFFLGRLRRVVAGVARRLLLFPFPGKLATPGQIRRVRQAP